MGWRARLIAGLLLVALISTWSAWKPAEDADPLLAELLAQRSDYVLHDFEIVSLNAEGEEAFTLTAPQMQQTIGARTMELTSPTFFVPQRDDRRWHVTANTGWVSENSDEVRLRGEVLAVPLNDDSLKIETEALNVFPQQELATSTELVTLTRPGATMHGTGMRAHLADNRVELLANTRFQHAPSHR